MLAILPSELPFFEAIAPQLGLELVALLEQLEEQVKTKDTFHGPGVTFHKDGAIKTLALHTEFPGLMFRDKDSSVTIDCGPLTRLESLKAFNVPLRLQVALRCSGAKRHALRAR